MHQELTNVQGTNNQRFAAFLRSGPGVLATNQITSNRDINTEKETCPLQAEIIIKKGQFDNNVLYNEERNHFSTS